MMGHREKLKGGKEYDAFSGWRRFLKPSAPILRVVKRGFNRRVRKLAKLDLKSEEE